MQSILDVMIMICIDAVRRYIKCSWLVFLWNVLVWIRMKMLDPSGSLDDMWLIMTI